ncbi:MAG: polysaccharide deacetylase family protein [Ancrocorticia sp.]
MSSLKRRARTLVRRGLDIVTSPVGSVLRFRGIDSAIALTFDDGPDPEVTPALLDVLADAGASATFFMLDTRVRRYPEIARSVRDAGHEIALHGLDHRRLTTLSHSEAAASIVRGKAELEAALDVQVRWFRPPYGAHDLSIWRAARSAGMDVMLWGPTLHDWAQETREQRWSKISARPGDIVLGHDGIAGAMDGASADAPPPNLDRARWAGEVLEHYRSQGLTSITVSEAARQGKAVRGARWTR